MKFTVTFVTLLSISSMGVLAKADEAKDKREAPTSYPSSSSGYSSNQYQSPLSQGDASSISVGAGYSIGGAKPTYTFGGQGLGAALQLSPANLQAGHGGSYQLPPITLQPNQDLSELMSQITKSLGSGLSLQPSNTVAEYHESQGQAAQGYTFPQFQQYEAPKAQQQYALAGQISSEPSYAAGTKGLSSYSTGPVLFNPADQGIKQPAYGYVAPNVAHSAGNLESLPSGGAQTFSGLSLGNSGYSTLGGAGLNLGSSGHSFASLGQSLGSAGLSYDGSGYTLGGAGLSSGSAGHSLGSSGYSLGSLSNLGQSQGESGHSLGNSGASGYSLEGSSPSGHSLSGSSGLSLGGLGHSFGGSISSPSKHYKVLSSGGHISSSKTAFKPSTFLGASIPSDSGSSSSYSASFPGYSSSSLGGSHSSFGGQGPSFASFGGYGGSSKGISPLYTKLEGSSFDSAGAYSSAGNLASPPGTSYGFPTSSYSGAVHAASSGSPQYYVSSSKYPSSFGEGSSSYRSPSSSYSSLSSSHSFGPKYSFSGRSARYSPKDNHGAFSETSYNTIKYSEELKPRVH